MRTWRQDTHMSSSAFDMLMEGRERAASLRGETSGAGVRGCEVNLRSRIVRGGRGGSFQPLPVSFLGQRRLVGDVLSCSPSTIWPGGR